MPTVQIQQLTKTYGDFHAVAELDLTIEDGQMICLLGPSGCGKTTTLRCVAGLENPTTGCIRIGDATVTDAARNFSLPPGKRNIGMVFQSYAIWPHLKVWDNVAYPLRRRRVKGQSCAVKVEQALEVVGLAGFADRRPTELSGGQQQRVALARAMVAHPDILLFDEPLSNLDARLRQTVREQIKRTHQTLGTASLYVTHDQVEALALADRVVVMSEGRVVQEGTPEDVFERPANRFVADFMGVENLLSGTCVHAAAGIARVDVPGIGELVATTTNGSIRPGDAVDVAIRGCDLSVGEDGDRHANRFAGTVRDVSFLGEHLEVAVEYGAGRVLARWPRRGDHSANFAPGSPVSLTVGAGHVYAMSSSSPDGRQ